MYKGTKITLRAKLYKAKQKAGQKAVNSRWEQCCENSQPAKFAGCQFLQPCKVSTVCFPFLQQFCSKFPLVRSCIFKFGSSSSCLNWIEEYEAFDLQNYEK